MGAFFKTFFVCLLLTFSFLMYKYFSVDGYSTNLEISQNNPIFGVHKTADPIEKEQFENERINTIKKAEQNSVQEIKKEPVEKNPKAVAKKYTHKCYFYSKNGNLALVDRELNAKPSVESAILILLKGPMIPETRQGLYSEIPANVDLINVSQDENKIVVNLSSNFGNGGGTRSVENRVKQLSKTVKLLEPKKKVYLHINGKEVEYLGGDGVYIKQPLD